jgi:hypothetical protein
VPSVVSNNYHNTQSIQHTIRQPTTTNMISSRQLLVDQIHMMRNKELAMHIVKDYLDEAYVAISSRERMTMIKWTHQVANQFGLDSQVAIVAINYLDRYLSNANSKSVQVALSSQFNFQLCAVACLIIAVKNVVGVSVGMDFFADTVCQGMYDKNTITKMELDVLDCLQWRVKVGRMQLTSRICFCK